MKSTALPNITVVLPEDTVNVYALAEEADVGLTFGSFIGLEMAMLGNQYSWHREQSTKTVRNF